MYAYILQTELNMTDVISILIKNNYIIKNYLKNVIIDRNFFLRFLFLSVKIYVI